MCFKAHLFRVWLYSSVYSIHNFSHDELWSTYEVLINWRTVGVKNVLKMDIISGCHYEATSFVSTSRPVIWFYGRHLAIYSIPKYTTSQTFSMKVVFISNVSFNMTASSECSWQSVYIWCFSDVIKSYHFMIYFSVINPS
jgi:hypothetical protein